MIALIVYRVLIPDFRWRRIAIAVSLLSCLTGQGCLTASMSTECRKFFSKPTSERERLFPNHDLETQLRLYRCGMNRRPPDSSLPIFIAEKGEAAVPTLINRLENEEDESFQLGMIDIFHVMAVKGYLRGRSDVTERIRQIVSRRKNPLLRDMAQERVKQIEKIISS